ncbi:hypothetical protein KKD88_01155 [Patescibacteria group bacterium]|nr:hypothetical protein [Patescibacteria group bacterium]
MGGGFCLKAVTRYAVLADVWCRLMLWAEMTEIRNFAQSNIRGVSFVKRNTAI